MHFFVRVTSDQVLRILQHDHMPDYVFGMVGAACVPNHELVCLHSGAKLFLNSEYQYSLCGYDYEHGHDVRCYQRVIHPWIPKHAKVDIKRIQEHYYEDYAVREQRHGIRFSLKKINSLHGDKYTWTRRQWVAFRYCFNTQLSTCAGNTYHMKGKRS